MTFKEAKKNYFDELMHHYGVLTKAELLARVSKTDIRCGWVDYVDCLRANGDITPKQQFNWGQVI